MAAFYPPEITSGTHFCQRLSQNQGHRVAGKIRSIEKKKPMTFQLAAKYLNKLQYCVSHITAKSKVKSLVSVPPFEIKFLKHHPNYISAKYIYLSAKYHWSATSLTTASQRDPNILPGIFTSHTSSYF
jgi:hypothetical protein